MRKTKNHKNEELEEEGFQKGDMEIRPVPLYAILFCGIIILVVGLYLFFNDTIANGFSVRTRSGRINGTQFSINGTGAIILGLAVCILPIYQLIKQRKKNKQKDIGSGFGDSDDLGKSL